MPLPNVRQKDSTITSFNQTELFSFLLILEKSTVQTTINTKAIVNYLDQLLKFLESFESWNELPVSEIINSDLDAVLSFLLHLDFQDLSSVLDEYLISLFGFFSFFPKSFCSRLISFGILEYMTLKLGLKAPTQSNFDKKILNFVSNLIIESPEIAIFLNQANFFKTISNQMDRILSDSSTKFELILLFNNASTSFCLLTRSDQRVSK